MSLRAAGLPKHTKYPSVHRHSPITHSWDLHRSLKGLCGVLRGYQLLASRLAKPSPDCHLAVYTKVNQMLCLKTVKPPVTYIMGTGFYIPYNCIAQ